MGERADCPNYPADLPKDLEQLKAWCEGRDKSFNNTYDARYIGLILNVPNVYPWYNLAPWNRCLPEFNYDDNDLRDFNILDSVFMFTASL